MPHAKSPVSEFARIITTHSIASDARIAIALSGGPDSTALAHILANWQHANGAPTPIRRPRAHPMTGSLQSAHALIINHGLRPEAAREAAHVANWAAGVGLRPLVHRLEWHAPPPPQQLMQQARLQRYNALAMLCKQVEITHLLVGHHLDDQLHTFVQRMASASGILGLSGMQEASLMQVGCRRVVTMLRPLLRVRKQALEHYCQTHALPAVTDPTNSDVRFQRNWINRELLAHCSGCGAVLEHCRRGGAGDPCLVDLVSVMDACADSAARLKRDALQALTRATTVEHAVAPIDDAQATSNTLVNVAVSTLPLLPWWGSHPPLTPLKPVQRFVVNCPSFVDHPLAVQRVAMSVVLQALAPAAAPPGTSVIQRMLDAIGGGRVQRTVHLPRYVLRALPGTSGLQAELKAGDDP